MSDPSHRHLRVEASAAGPSLKYECQGTPEAERWLERALFPAATQSISGWGIGAPALSMAPGVPRNVAASQPV